MSFIVFIIFLGELQSLEIKDEYKYPEVDGSANSANTAAVLLNDLHITSGKLIIFYILYLILVIKIDQISKFLYAKIFIKEINVV